MSLNTLTDFFDDFLPPASEERIKIVENEIGINFPSSFIKVIKICDGGTPISTDFEFFDVYFQQSWGAGVGCFLRINKSPYSEILRTYNSPPEFFPDGLVAFAETGGGDLICFDYRGGKDNPDPPIVYWNHEADIGKDVSFIADNFETFLRMLKEPAD